MKLRLLVASLAGMAISACGQDAGTAKTVKELEMASAGYQAEIRAMDARLRAMNTIIEGIGGDIAEIKQSENLKRSAILTPGADGYQVVEFNQGKLLLDLTDVSAYASGCKVKIKFGNISSVTISGLKGQVTWGQKAKEGEEVALKRKPFSVSQDLLPGVWNVVTLTLEEIPPTVLSFVQLKDMQADGVRLTTAR